MRLQTLGIGKTLRRWRVGDFAYRRKSIGRAALSRLNRSVKWKDYNCLCCNGRIEIIQSLGVGTDGPRCWSGAPVSLHHCRFVFAWPLRNPWQVRSALGKAAVGSGGLTLRQRYRRTRPSQVRGNIGDRIGDPRSASASVNLNATSDVASGGG